MFDWALKKEDIFSNISCVEKILAPQCSYGVGSCLIKQKHTRYKMFVSVPLLKWQKGIVLRQGSRTLNFCFALFATFIIVTLRN